MSLLPSREFLAVRVPFGLRRFESADFGALYDIESDPFLKQYVGGANAKPREEWLAQCDSLPSDSVQFALEHTPSGTLAGRVTLGHYRASDVREVQVILARAFVGRGLGRAAFDLACSHAFSSLGAQSIVAVVDPAHKASLRLVTAAGLSEISPETNASGQTIKRVFALRRAA